MECLQVSKISYLDVNQDANSAEIIRIESLENLGFEYVRNMFPSLPQEELRAGVKLPDGKILNRNDLGLLLTPLKFGNREQITALKALEYLDLVEEFLSKKENNQSPTKVYSQELEKRKQALRQEGFVYSWEGIDPFSRVFSPSGFLYDESTCEDILWKLRFGSKRQIEALKALELIMLDESPEDLVLV